MRVVDYSLPKSTCSKCVAEHNTTKHMLSKSMYTAPPHRVHGTNDGDDVARGNDVHPSSCMCILLYLVTSNVS